MAQIVYEVGEKAHFFSLSIKTGLSEDRVPILYFTYGLLTSRRKKSIVQVYKVVLFFDR